MENLTASGELVDVSTAVISGEASYDHLGYDPGLALDYDQDGASDLIVGAKEHDEEPDLGSCGKIYFLYGPFSGEREVSTAEAWYAGTAPGAYVGVSISAPGDLDGDGNLDLAWSEGGTADSEYTQVTILYGSSF